MSDTYPIVVHPDCDCFDHLADDEYLCICGGEGFCLCELWKTFYREENSDKTASDSETEA